MVQGIVSERSGFRIDGAPTERPSRSQAIESLRIASAFGIVAFHARAPLPDLTYAGLVIFLTLSPMMDTLFNWERVRSVKNLADRLLAPWAFWSLAYALFNFVSHKPLLPTPEPVGGILMGTSQHLWFLPFVFAVLFALNAFKQVVGPAVLFWCGVAISAAMLASVDFWRPVSLNWALPLPQWVHAAPAVFIGIAIGLAGRVGRSAAFGGPIVAAGLAVAAMTKSPGLSVTYPVGVAATAIVVLAGRKWLPANWSAQPVADCMLGVYLIHILPLSIVSRVTGEGTYVTVIVTFLISLGAVWAARRVAPMSKLVLG